MKNKRLIMAWIMMIGWMALIFYMSHQPGDVSSKQSGLVLKIFEILGLNLSDKFGELASFIVRKAAHFTEYFILYWLISNVLGFYYNTKEMLIYGLIATILYAISDEIHQYFIPARAMAFKDVLIDSSGAILSMLIKSWNERIKIKKKNIQKINKSY